MNHRVTLILASVAGFADTTTFLSGPGIFSAHVTGNFVLLAHVLESGWVAGDIVKVTAFGVFALGVIATTAGYDALLAKRPAPVQRAWLLSVEAGLLGVAAIAGVVGAGFGELAALIVVLAMALQNVFHRTVPEAQMPSTVMTLNFTQAMMDTTRHLFRSRSAAAGPPRPFFTPSWYAIGGFMVGCVAGALLSHAWGLVALIVPAALLATMAAWLARPAAA
jgi:uncharacterized membrane protein YoaK (UPF0700 family)